MQDPWRDLARAGAWLRELEREHKPVLVHSNQFAFSAVRFDAPVVVVAHSCVLSWWRAVHGTAPPPSLDRYKHAVRRGLNRAALVVAPTGAMLGTLRENYGYEHGVVIANGRSAQCYLPGRKEPVIFAAGRMWDLAKNLTALEVVACGVPWPIRVAGPYSQPDGGSREPAGVQALGELAPDAIARQYARAAIYAFPARYEPFGLSILEAALAGCALVLGDIPSLRELWGSTALYVPPDDHEALRACLRRLIADDALRGRLARAARTRALAYSPERMADGYLEAYDTVLKQVRPVYRTLGQPTESEARACAS
jgi:glycosyltransferase involved in cell wall biosynthesis